MTTAKPAWEAVRDPADRRRVVYWRLPNPDRIGAYIGAISRRDGLWSALGYSLTGALPPSGNVPFGRYPTRRRAERVIEDYASGYRPCASCDSRCLWGEDAWTCTRCGDEWHSDHGPEYAVEDATPDRRAR